MSNLQREIDALSQAANDVLALTQEQRAELDARAARYRQNPSDVIPGSKSGQTCSS
jgi:putative addiction module component (TIGR02574 family)